MRSVPFSKVASGAKRLSLSNSTFFFQLISKVSIWVQEMDPGNLKIPCLILVLCSVGAGDHWDSACLGLASSVHSWPCSCSNLQPSFISLGQSSRTVLQLACPHCSLPWSLGPTELLPHCQSGPWTGGPGSGFASLPPSRSWLSILLSSGLKGAPLVAQTVKNLPTGPETWVWPLGLEDRLEKGTATHSSILDWRIPWIGEPGGLQSMGSKKSQTQLSN